jgi:hypothetical protein
MPAGRITTLLARPSQCAHLSFDADGIIGTSSAQLGAAATAFDFRGFYANLRRTVAGNSARLQYDSAGIVGDPSVVASSLMTLRAEPKKAHVDRAVASRESAFYRKYNNQAAIIAQMNLFYSSANAGSKPAMLAQLSTLSQNQANLLNTAYAADGRTGVVKWTSSTLNSVTNTTGNSASETSGGSSSSSSGWVNLNGDSGTEGTTFTGSSNPSAYNYGNTASNSFSTNAAANSQQNWGTGDTTSVGQLLQAQSVINTDYGYRVPSIESAAQDLRAQISLMDERFAQFMFGQDLPQLNTVFANELLSIDLDVKKLQVAFLDTILMSPIAGIVTQIHRYPGDWVKAGEPVIRIENDQSVFLVGSLIYRDAISVGANATVTTALFGQSAAAVSISGQVLAARGTCTDDARHRRSLCCFQKAKNNQFRGRGRAWDVVIQCSNTDVHGNKILPLNYHFDLDDTTVEIT